MANAAKEHITSTIINTQHTKQTKNRTELNQRNKIIYERTRSNGGRPNQQIRKTKNTYGYRHKIRKIKIIKKQKKNREKRVLPDEE